MNQNESEAARRRRAQVLDVYNRNRTAFRSIARRPSSSTPSRVIALVAVSLIISAVSGCEYSTQTKSTAIVPQLIGTPLDEATALLDERGFDNVDTEDAAEDRTIFAESNWVVVAQSLPPDRSVPTDAPIVLGAAKPSDARYAELLAAAGDSSKLDEQKASSRADREAKRNPCKILAGVTVDSRVFSDQLQAPRSDVGDYENGFRPVKLACANDDLGLAIELNSYPTPDLARDAATQAVTVNPDDRYATDMMIGSRGTVVKYPGGGGYLLNPDTGVGRQSFNVGTWQILTEANFDDAQTAALSRQPDPIPAVVSVYNQLRSKAAQVIPGDNW
ncbi:PASTA domain-containing protein [Gordonia sp. UCD-TK1]|uniref:PASTA domain-containing protein n=1 Tax=Gordonia sp. UCD-TK1 TaxID=1857893 RepID=UPI00080E8DCB|nr:PASTA domain-containing protein [Gordonia sp. UCD-TK1]OCH81473.1 hypothetical protein A9310_17465 [Gordonia sp. UCD-TK1]